MTAACRQTATGIRFDIRVIPRAPRTVVEGLRDGRLLVRVTAAPVDGAANEAVIRAIAETFAVPKARVTVVSGDTARNKTVEIAAISSEAVASKLAELV